MKKIFAMGFLMVTLLASVGGGTWAWFQDTETSANNSLTAGTLDLNINGGNSSNATFSLVNLAPGDNGTGYGTLSNVGSLAGGLDISISNMAGVGGSGGTEFEDGVADLWSNVRAAIFVDVDQNGVWSAGDVGLSRTNGVLYYYPTGPYYDPFSWYNGKSWDAVVTLAGGAADDIVLMWKIDPSVGNEIQGDSMTFDINFTLEQAGVD